MTLENQMGLVPLVQQAIDFNSYNFLYVNSALETLKNNLTITQDGLEHYKPLVTNAVFYSSCIASFASTNFVANFAYSALFVPAAVTTLVPSAVVIGVGAGYLGINSYISYQVGIKAAQKTESFMDNLCSLINASPAVEEKIDYELTIEETYWEDLDELYDKESWGILNILKNSLTINSFDDVDEDIASLSDDDGTSSIDSDDYYSVCDYEEFLGGQKDDLTFEAQSFEGGFFSTLLSIL